MSLTMLFLKYSLEILFIRFLLTEFPTFFETAIPSLDRFASLEVVKNTIKALVEYLWLFIFKCSKSFFTSNR